MTIQANATRNQYTATSGQTVFNYNFEITALADLVVFQGTTLLTLTTDYTITGLAVETGGTMVLVTGATTGDILTIFRTTAQERLTDYQNSGDFLADEVNADFDRIYAIIQETSNTESRSVQLSSTSTTALPVTITDPNALEILRWNAAGTEIESIPLSSIAEADDATDLLYLNAGSTLTATNTGAAIDALDVKAEANEAAILLKYDKTGGEITGQVTSTAGDFNLVTNTALSDAAATLTAAQLIGGEFTITPTVARIQTLDTAANIISALSGSVDNSNFEFTIVNLAAFDVTIATATGVTLVGNMVVNDGNATFRARRLSGTTVSITRLEAEANPTITGSTVFTQSTNNIGLTNIGAIGLAIGDVIRPDGSTNNDKDFTVEVITDANNIIVNQAHAGGTTTKSLVNETVSATIALIARAKFAPLGLGQGSVNVAGSRSAGSTYTNNTKRPFQVNITCNASTGQNAQFVRNSINESTIVDWRNLAGGNVFASAQPVVLSTETYGVSVSGAVIEQWFEVR